MRAARDRRGGGGEEAEVLGRDGHLGLDARDRLADVARFEFRQLLAVRVDCVGQRVHEPRALGRGRLAPRALERRAGRRDRAVDVRFARDRGAGERSSGRRLDQIADVTGGRLDRLTVDEQTVFASRGDRHSTGGRYPATADCGQRITPAKPTQSSGRAPCRFGRRHPPNRLAALGLGDGARRTRRQSMSDRVTDCKRNCLNTCEIGIARFVRSRRCSAPNPSHLRPLRCALRQ